MSGARTCTSFEGMCAVASGRRVAFRDRQGGRPADLTIWTVTANTFGLLGVAPMLGRDFVQADEAPGASPVVILGHRFWATRFGKSAEVVGSTVFVGGVPATVVGVMPERFEFPHQSNFWMPAVRTPELERRGSGRRRLRGVRPSAPRRAPSNRRASNCRRSIGACRRRFPGRTAICRSTWSTTRTITPARTGRWCLGRSGWGRASCC